MNDEVQRYIDAVTDSRRALMERLQAIILALYPQATVKLWYRIPAYHLPTGWVALGYWKQGVSLYTNGPAHLAAFKAAHPKKRLRKGSINFSINAPLPEDDIRIVITHAMEHSPRS